VSSQSVLDLDDEIDFLLTRLSEAQLGGAPGDASRRESEAYIRAILEASRDCLKIVDLDGRLEFMNAHGQSLLDIEDFAPCVGAEWCAFWPADSQAMVRDALVQARAGTASRFQAMCPTMRGASKWWDVMIVPLRDSQGTINRIMSVSRDITQQKQT
jgi:two-component system, sensor histidine kinase PdtaS